MRNHCHFTGTYRGAAHSVCNFQYRLSPKAWKLPVAIHNLKGYDGHLIVKALKSAFGRIDVIPQNMERYLSLTVGRLKFLDSFQFTPKGLDELAKTMTDDELKYTVATYPTADLPLIRRKGVYPYDHMDRFVRFDEVELPSQAAFHNKLSGDSCTDADYEHAAAIWNAFGCETMGDYHDVYLQLDVLLLVDFFENFRHTCLSYYGLDPLHYYTTPGLAWDAALRMSRGDLNLITNNDIYNMVDVVIRGGVLMISTRHAKLTIHLFHLMIQNYHDKT